MTLAWVVLAALILEAVIGYPAALQAYVPHPVIWAGQALSFFERHWNLPSYAFGMRRVLGAATVVIVVGAAGVLGWLVQNAFYSLAPDDCASSPWVLVTDALEVGLIAAVGTVGLAQKSLFFHVRDVLVPLSAGDLGDARQRVSMIVGRDTQRLDTSGVASAALESLAESFNDGIVAPAFWFLIGGLPGLFAYKALNTADSLIGHMEERWRAFGWAAARADDVANLIPARLAGVLLAFAGLLASAGLRGFRVMFRDASKHASPNAGWPEAAMAGALGVRLGGPTSYDGVVHSRPVFGNGPLPDVDDLARGLRLYVVACGLLWLIVLGVGLIDWPHSLEGLPCPL